MRCSSLRFNIHCFPSGNASTWMPTKSWNTQWAIRTRLRNCREEEERNLLFMKLIALVLRMGEGD